MNNDVLWIFLHLPKSGGTTFKGHIFNHSEWDETFVEFSHWGRSYRAKNGRKNFADRTVAERSKAKYLFGHRTYFGIHKLVPDKTPLYITIVRCPAERCISLYNFRRSKGSITLEFPEWYAQKYRSKPNPMTDFYAKCLVDREIDPNDPGNFDLAKKALEQCWYVGKTDGLDSDLKFLFRQMGLPEEWENFRIAGQTENKLKGIGHPSEGEVVTKFIELDDALRDQIYADSKLDLELYQWACERKQQLQSTKV